METGASLVSQTVKNMPAPHVTRSIPGWRGSPGGGSGNPLQYSCLGNPMDRGAWRDTVPGVIKRWTRLSDSAHTHKMWAAKAFCRYPSRWWSPQAPQKQPVPMPADLRTTSLPCMLPVAYQHHSTLRDGEEAREAVDVACLLSYSPKWNLSGLDSPLSEPQPTGLAFIQCSRD